MSPTVIFALPRTDAAVYEFIDAPKISRLLCLAAWTVKGANAWWRLASTIISTVTLSVWQ